jgi:hypothetical protein
VQGVAKGVSSKYVDGSSILATDLEVTLQADAVNVTPESQLTLDGKSAQVLRVMKVPPSGVTVVYRGFVRV